MIKKIILIGSVVLLGLACKKEITGPKGDKGDKGDTGVQGNAGLSNQKVYFGQVQIGSWVSNGGTNGNYLYTSTILFPTYSANTPQINVDSSTFIIYVDTDTSTNSHLWAPLPYNENGNTISFAISQLTVQVPTLMYTKYDGSMPNTPTRNFDLKMVIITK